LRSGLAHLLATANTRFWGTTTADAAATAPAAAAAAVVPAGEILLEKRYDGMSAADAHLQRISDHVSAYLQIVRSQLLATVPKAVVHCTVVPAKENLLSLLQEEVACE
jgi:hypothetical protein